jgi:hypothetical protein
MVVKLTEAQKNYGDAGLYVVALTCRSISTMRFLMFRMILNGLQLQEEFNIPGYILINTNEIALSWVLEYIQDPNCPVKQKVRYSKSFLSLLLISLSDLSTVLAIVRTVIGTKQISRLQGDELNKISVLVVESFLNSLNSSITASWSPNIRYLHVFGDVMSSHTIKGVAIDFGLPLESPKSLKNVKLALFNVSLVPAEIDNENYQPIGKNITFELEESHPSDPFERLRTLANELISLGVIVIASQKLIHPFLQRLLLDKARKIRNCVNRQGIIPLERLSNRHIDAVRALSGATVVSSVYQHLTAQDLGYLAAIDEKEFNNFK